MQAPLQGPSGACCHMDRPTHLHSITCGPSMTKLSGRVQRHASTALASTMSGQGRISKQGLLPGPHAPHQRSGGFQLSSRKLLQPNNATSGQGVVAAEPPKASVSPFVNVVLPTAFALLVCNMDRICLSVAILPMSAEFGWPATMQGVIQAAFLWGYMATQLAGGALADKFGGKRVMAGGILWFSVASALLPLALSAPVVAAGLTIPAVLASRCLVGLGEGVALPSMNNLIAAHVPKEAKARGLGMAFSGFHTGNLLGLLISPLLLTHFGWRGLFYIFGFLGLPLLAFWLWSVPDRPNQAAAAVQPSSGTSSSSSSAAAAPADASYSGTGDSATSRASGKASTSGHELASSGSSSSIDSGPSILSLLSSSATWAIIVANVVNHWGYFIYLNWMPTYFNKALGFDLRASSFLAFLPWLVMATGSTLSGVLADSLVSRGVSVTTVRKSLQAVAFLIPAVALVILSQPGISPQNAVVCMTVALGTTSLGQAGFVANMSDIAPKQAGRMFGLCNTFGCFSGIVGVTAVGFIVDAFQSFSPVFQITAGLYVFGTVIWLAFCRGEKVFD